MGDPHRLATRSQKSGFRGVVRLCLNRGHNVLDYGHQHGRPYESVSRGVIHRNYQPEPQYGPQRQPKCVVNPLTHSLACLGRRNFTCRKEYANRGRILPIRELVVRANIAHISTKLLRCSVTA